MLRDSYGRVISDLRISVTDRCNFRCIYCRSAEPENYEPADNLLTWKEMLRLTDVLGRMGIRKVRVTGGEPLVRKGLEEFIGKLGAQGHFTDLSMTTNGMTLAARAAALKEAGIGRVNISVDSLRADRFERITRTPDALGRVLEGIVAAQAAGLGPVKVNAVLVRGFNDDEIVDFVEFARERGVVLRFIEFMPLDADHIWDNARVVTAGEIRQRLDEAGFRFLPLPAHYAGETAVRLAFADGAPGEIGIVAPVSAPFCGKCSRIRLTADGKIRTCLFSREDHDLREMLRNDVADSEIMKRVGRIIETKEDGHHINDPDFTPANRTMVFIGG